jgi:acetyl esterase
MSEGASSDTRDVADVDQRRDGPGASQIDPTDPAAPMYRLLASIRKPVALRDIMVYPVRTGYIGKDQPAPPADFPRWDAMFPGVTVETVRLPSPAGPIRCQVYRPGAGQALPMLIYVHGGGFMIGQSEDTDYMTRRLCAENRAIVVSVNYRLAPEWPFPAGLDDCLAVLGWLREHGRTLGGNTERIGVAGDSSGASFAASLPLRARDQGVRPPDVSVQFAPVLDMRFEQYESFNRMAPTGIVYDAAFMGFARGAYCSYAEWDHPHVSPVRADLHGYPPALIVCGTHDPLVDSCRAFAQKLQAAGNAAAELFVRDGMPHGFYFWPGMFREEQDAYAAVRSFLQRHLRCG